MDSRAFLTPRGDAHQVGANDKVDFAAHVAPSGQSCFQSAQFLRTGTQLRCDLMIQDIYLLG